MVSLNADWTEFLSLLILHRVKFLLVGGHAVAVHGRPRFTEDLDVLIDPTARNAARVRAALDAFGFGAVMPSIEELCSPEKVFMLGVKPFRIDILTTISGITFARAWRSRTQVKTTVGLVPVIGRKMLIANKLASGRPKDVADVALLTEGAAPKRRR